MLDGSLVVAMLAFKRMLLSYYASERAVVKDVHVRAVVEGCESEADLQIHLFDWYDWIPEKVLRGRLP